MDSLFSILHVAAAVFVVGPMAILPMSALRSIRAGHIDQAASVAKSTRLFSLLSLVVVVFGFALLGMADPKYHLSITTPWVLSSLIAYVIALILNLAVVVPALGKVAAGAPGRYRGRIAMGSGIVAILLLGVVVLMVWKP